MPDPIAPDLHIALVEPDIPWNAGNVGRSCLALGARLHLVRPLGFSIDERRVRRAGLDYWRHVDLEVWPSWTAFGGSMEGLGAPWLFSAEAERSLWDLDLTPPTVLIFGRESTGLREDIRERHRERLVRIPMDPGPVRSLNVSTAAAVALAEAKRQRTRT
ncbi:MAG: tRNA (cytidine(34)-2'-O)-methyltransferase [Acidobacteriota bacterium]